MKKKKRRSSSGELYLIIKINKENICSLDKVVEDVNVNYKNFFLNPLDLI